MKYVAFVDTLGFRERLLSISHNEAKALLSNFNQEIYRLWSEYEYQNDNTISGRTFSDSLVVFTIDDTAPQLRKLIRFLSSLYRVSMTKCDLPLRGGVAIGEFEDIKANEFVNLQKAIVVGGAFIDAYGLESANGIKGSKILFRQNIKLKIEAVCPECIVQRVKQDAEGREIYELKWGDISYLSDNQYSALKNFLFLACKSEWINHYYSTLETFLIKESRRDKKDIYIEIIRFIKINYDYRMLDMFIQNFMTSNCSQNLKSNFLGFIRERLWPAD